MPWPRLSLETKAVPVEPPRIRISSQLTWLLIRSVRGPRGPPRTVGRAPTIHAEAARNLGGHPERPKRRFVRTWIGPMTANNSRSRTLRSAARTREVSDAASAVAVEGDAVQLHAMIDEAEAELFGDP